MKRHTEEKLADLAGNEDKSKELADLLDTIKARVEADQDNHSWNSVGKPQINLALSAACQKGANRNIRVLLESIFSKDLAYDDFLDAYTHAAISGNPESLSIMNESLWKMEINDPSKYTIILDGLGCAAASGNSMNVRYLLDNILSDKKAGKIIESKMTSVIEERSRWSFVIACRAGHVETARIIYGNLRELTFKPENPDAVDKNGIPCETQDEKINRLLKTALNSACLAGQHEITKLLIQDLKIFNLEEILLMEIKDHYAINNSYLIELAAQVKEEEKIRSIIKSNGENATLECSNCHNSVKHKPRMSRAGI